MPKRKCPVCKSINIINLAPTCEGVEAEKHGEFVLEGCGIQHDSAQYVCCNCQFKWGGESYEDIRLIKACVESFCDSNYNVEINFQDRKALHKDGFYIKKECQKSLDSESLEKFKEGLENCKILNWKRRYMNHYVLDGTQWNVEIEFNNGLSTKKEGSNKYPKEWEQFCTLIESLVGRRFE